MSDIESHDDCRALVESFYARARGDDRLGPIFELRVEGRWPEHLGKMADFWAAIILGQPGYAGRPLERHLGLGIVPGHFERWLALWTATVDERWAGAHAEHAKLSARHIAQRMAAFACTRRKASPCKSQRPAPCRRALRRHDDHVE